MPMLGDPEASADLLTILGSFTNYVQNERVRAYNEGIDTERARCAKIAEDCANLKHSDYDQATGLSIAQTIRSESA